MCGIAGVFSLNENLSFLDGGLLLKQMGNKISHRGPDDTGIWFDHAGGIGMVHKRLSIVDLSPSGHQPMHSQSQRYIMVFNGEIYNHKEIRNQLLESGICVAWRGHSDTETLLAGFDAWGVEQTIMRTIGMFAIAVWDRDEKKLTLIRDRVGEKPLYYGWQNGTFLFGSELKAIKQHPNFNPEIDRNSLSLFLRYNYIPAPYSIYKGIYKLKPGSILTVSSQAPEPQISEYWSATAVAKSGIAAMYSGSETSAIDQLDFLLRDSIKQQMVADVSLGAFLSGGVDSSTVIAIMQSQSSTPVNTFSIGFKETGYNEAVYAKQVAEHLGTEHTELYVTSEQAMSVIPLLPQMYDEPFADSSQIPTFLVSKLAKRHVTVALSGDGGDELFCGYNRYLLADKVWKTISRCPTIFRKLAAESILSISPENWNRLGQLGTSRLRRISNLGDKLHKGAAVLGSGKDELYNSLVSLWPRPAEVVINSAEYAGGGFNLEGLDQIQRMMVLDILTYLPDDILVKLDRASMGVSLETRVPFLDHRLIEFAWSLPQNLKLRHGETKWILRQLLYRYIPRSIIDRPKMGFGIPLDRWLRGPLKDWAESLLDEGRLKREGFFHASQIRSKWNEHLSGRRNWAYQLWGVLMFQAWLEEQAR